MNILFLCTGNSCRSQMAEGWAKSLLLDKAQFYSAGTKKHGLNPLAVEVMKESGVDISQHQSKTLNDIGDVQFDVVYTVCSNADETCPPFGGAQVIHVGFDDPPSLTAGMTDVEQVRAVYRRVRDEIREFIKSLEI